jgi:hypothetical protein
MAGKMHSPKQVVRKLREARPDATPTRVLYNFVVMAESGCRSG